MHSALVAIMYMYLLDTKALFEGLIISYSDGTVGMFSISIYLSAYLLSVPGAE